MKRRTFEGKTQGKSKEDLKTAGILRPKERKNPERYGDFRIVRESAWGRGVVKRAAQGRAWRAHLQSRKIVEDDRERKTWSVI